MASPRRLTSQSLPKPDTIPPDEHLDYSEGAATVSVLVQEERGPEHLAGLEGANGSHIWGAAPDIVLRNFGRLLAPTCDGHEDHVRARPVDADGGLTYFVSHNWSTCRTEKFLALAVYFNGRRAIIASLCTQLVVFGLVLGGVLPMVPSARDTEISIWCTLSAFASYWTVILFCHELDSRVKMGRSRVFFDKVCIDQSNPDAKSKGIRNITTYLERSETLLVLLSDVYLEKIWTVFELTVFLALKPRATVSVQPLPLASIVTFLMLLCACVTFLEGFTGGSVYHHVINRQGHVILLLVAAFGIAASLRRWGRAFVQLEKKINNFSFARSECLHRSDREIIRQACYKIAVGCELVQRSATLKEACQAVELRARLLVPGAVHRGLTPSLIPWRYAIVFHLMAFSKILDGLCSVITATKERSIIQTVVAVSEILVDSLAMPVSIAIVGYFICYLPKTVAGELVRLSVLTSVVMSIMLMAGGAVEQLVADDADGPAALAAVNIMLLGIESATIGYFYMCPCCL